jgi:ADP-heptose:LPS heptosyltransferase
MKLYFQKGVWISKRGKAAAEAIDSSEIRNVAVIRHAALGDMILTRNFLIELKLSFPNAFITFSAVSNYTSGIPVDLVDRVHILETSRKGLDYLRNTKDLHAQDIIFDLAATTRSMWLCKTNKAKLKIGFPYHAAQRYFYDIVVPRSDMHFEVDNMLDELKVFGFVPQIPHVYNLPGAALKRDKPYILYFTTASTIKKCWPIERFMSLITKMSNSLPHVDHLVLEGKDPWESIGKIAEDLLGRSNVSLVNAGTVEEVIRTVKGATIVISNDTSVRNIAIAAGIPSVGIFFSPAIFRYLPMPGNHLIVFNRDGSLPEVEQVFESSLALLQKSLPTAG